MVTDAAHGFWKDKSWVLMITSVFSPVLKRWMPILMSFMDGGLTEYYQIHFITTFQTIASQALQKGINIKDTMFVIVRSYFYPI